MKKRILSLLLAFLMLFSIFPAHGTYAVEAGNEVTVWYFNSATESMEQAETVELYRGGEIYLSAILRDDINGSIQWQIEAEQDFWVDIQGGTSEDIRVSYGMVKSLLRNDTVRMRCAAADGEAYHSDPVTVTVTDIDNRAAASTFTVEQTPAAPDPLPAPTAVTNVDDETAPVVTEEAVPVLTEAADAAEIEETVVTAEESAPLASVMPLSSSSAPFIVNTNTSDEDVEVCTVTIEYVYSSNSKYAGQRVALPYIYEATKGQSLTETVTSPNCVGYAPNHVSYDLSSLGPIPGNVNLVVEYAPAEVSYTVRHYQQNVDDDEYTWVDTTMVTGHTEALTSDDAAKTYTGFTALSHYHEEIAADSSTMIDIYYDRNYYLMSFDLDGGYGVEAVYARYGASVSVSDPQRAGYSFKFWSLDGVTETTLPATMPASSQSYISLWSAGNTTYTIAYWLENADTAGQYDFVGSVTVDANSGDVVSGSDNAVANAIFTSEDGQYYSYNTNKTDSKVSVAGDGSTVVNVYYDRNVYILRFYYARSYVENGTTYYEISHSNSYYDTVGEDVSAASWSGKHTTKPDLADKYTEQTGTVGTDTTHTYYFFELTVKYGQNISDIWPHTPIENATDATVFSKTFVSWGTQPGSGYYKNNSNKNIKGPYSTVTSALLTDASAVSPAVNHNLVAYYGSPTMWTVYIYYSAMKDETATKTYGGQEYVLQGDPIKYGAQINSVADLTNLEFPGVEFVAREDGKNNNDESDSYSTQWYYKRTEHTVTLDDNYGNTTTYTIPYGGTIRSYITAVPTPSYPKELPDGAYEFGGWYQSKEGIGALDTSIAMPNEDLIYYAKWVPVVYTVTINNGNGTVLSTEEVSYGANATKPTDPTMDDATFIGWYYKDERGEEQRFDFDNMTITQDITIYAKWRSNVMKQVEVYYVVEDQNGNQTQIADTETLMLRLGQTRTFEAKTGSSLYVDYRAGCFPVTASHSITPTDAHLDSEKPITYTFVYKQYDAVPYQVAFYVKELDGTVRPAFQVTNGVAEFVDSATYGTWTDDQKKRFAASNTSGSSGTDLTEGGQYIEQHWDNDKAVVTELYVPDNLSAASWVLPDAYLPNALKIQKIIVPSSKEGADPETDIKANTIEFIYTYSEPEVDPDDPNASVYEARYLVQHYIQNSSDTTKYDLYSYSDETGLSGETAAASPISIPGYTYRHDVTSQYMEEYNKEDYRKNAAPNVLAQNPDTMTGTITADDKLELNFYYAVNSYPYQVMYLEEGTNRVLAAGKTADSNGNKLTGLYGSTVTETAIELEGYDVVGTSSKTIYIQMEAGDIASVNTIVFYYKLKSAELVLKKSVKLDATQAAQEGISQIPSWVYDQEFVFTVYRPEGYPKSVYHYTFTGADGNSEERTVNAGVRTIEVCLKHGESIRFHDFPMGTYTVTETYVPGFRTSVDGYIAQAHTVALDSDGEVGTLAFLNTFPFYTGDLVIKKNVTKLNSTDPTATDPYKVTVVLNPDDSTREVDRVITWTDAGATEASSFTVPARSETNTETTFTIEISVPVGGEVKMEGVPAGSFTVTEEVKGTVGYIYDYYTVKYNKAVHENDEVTGTNHVVSGSIHGGHPTAVTFHNTYKKGALTINKTVTQEYANDTWQRDTFTFTITGTTELPDGDYTVNGASVSVSKGAVTVKDANGNDPAISITKTDDATSWSDSLTFENLPAGYYTVTETAGLGNDKYDAVGPKGSLLVDDTTTATVADFTNTYKRHHANLTITTAGALYNTSDSFIFNVTTANGYHLRLVVPGNSSATIRDLPLGTYQVALEPNWSWRYGIANNFVTGGGTEQPPSASPYTTATVILATADAVATFDQTVAINKWLSDSYYQKYQWNSASVSGSTTPSN